MDLGAAGLTKQPFPIHGEPLATVVYASHQHGLNVLNNTRRNPNGLCLIQGPALSGKSTLVRHFVNSAPESSAVAVIDAAGLDTLKFLERILSQFGYEMEQSSISELLAMLRVFCLQQATSHEPPILIIENTQTLAPNSLRILCELAKLKMRSTSALKIVLVSDRSLNSIVHAPAMKSVQERLVDDFHMHPMTSMEARNFLHDKLRAAGSKIPESIFPVTVCNDLWRASGGWPGILDRIALLALSKANSLPVAATHVEHPVVPHGTWPDAAVHEAEQSIDMPAAPPVIFVTFEGKTVQELHFDQKRFLIGRSLYNDITIPSRFLSRHHAMLVRNDSATYLMDLNSTNGTFVNSKRISIYPLMHEDVIAVGNHRMKFIDPTATNRESVQEIEFNDTVVMKTLEDMRRLLAQENTQVWRTATENLPTSGV